MPEPKPVLIIGAGNEFRSDDAAGLVVARLLRDRVSDYADTIVGISDGTELLDLWNSRPLVYLIDAIHANLEAGEIRRFDLPDEKLPAEYTSTQSTHSFNVGEAIELGKALDSMPERLSIIGVQGENFESGTEISESVRASIERVAKIISEEVKRLNNNSGGDTDA